MNRGRPEAKGEYTDEGRPYQGTLIREIRQSADKTINVFAAEISLHPDSLSRVELNTARVGGSVLKRIAERLNVPLEALATAPIHPRLRILKTSRRTSSLQSIGDQVDEIIASANLPEGKYNLARQLILDTSRAIILRLGVS